MLIMMVFLGYSPPTSSSVVGPNSVYVSGEASPVFGSHWTSPVHSKPSFENLLLLLSWLPSSSCSIE
jgi:hypothetical protein